MRQPTVDDVINGYFESLRSSPEEVQAMVNAWPIQINETPDEEEEEEDDGLEIIERALDMFASFLTRADPNDD